ncbi:ribosome assembly protein 1 [Diutina catenulata]
MKLSEDTIATLQGNPKHIRNICILAHVDHGKTSLSDSLLATNGVISQRLVGKVRYLDSRPDEQQRGITMESSAISLYFKILRKQRESEEVETNEYLINLIDSPGHIDFSSEVSSSARLCDGALVLVDVVEGVCSQTVNVLRQCWLDQLKPILVLNKIDRLISEWQYSPAEAYLHMSQVIEQVNSVIGSFYQGDRLADDLQWREQGQEGEYVERSDDDLYFAPEKGNVVFASAIDGWAFNVSTFSKIYAAKLGFSQAVLAKTLWGDFYLDTKNKKIVPGSKYKGNGKPLFVSLILDQIWAIYSACLLDRDQEKLEKMVEKLGSRISQRELKSKDHKNLLSLIMTQWIPLSHAILSNVIEYLPNPIDAQGSRFTSVLTESMGPDYKDKLDPAFVDSIMGCDSQNPENRTLAYVSKILSIPEENLPREAGPAMSLEEIKEKSRKARELAKKISDNYQEKATEDEFEVVGAKKDPFEWEFEEEDFEFGGAEEEEEPVNEVLVAFTRVYSGSLTVGQKVTVVGPKYDSEAGPDDESNAGQLNHEVEITDLFLLMGRDLIRVKSVPAGNIVGVRGLDGAILKTGTICSCPAPYPNLAATSTMTHNKPIMKVAIEPENPMQLQKLERGLELLATADPVFEWTIDDDSGELIVCVAGELHLERCIRDLEDRFAKGCAVTIKEPVIPFREGLVSKTEVSESLDVEEESDSVDGVQIEFSIAPLPTEVTEFLITHEAELALVAKGDQEVSDHLKSKLEPVLKDSDAGFTIDDIVLAGPKRMGPNLLVEPNGKQFRRLFSKNEADKFIFESSVIQGFSLATNEGPLAAEPLQGTVTTIISASRDDEVTDEDFEANNTAGRVLNYTRQQIHGQFLKHAPRLFLAMYTCEIQATTEVLGKVYAVVQKRGGSIISEEMKEGTPFFTIIARIPVVEAFGFSEDIRKKTSGSATPQLVFDGFDVLDIDPFWVPHTEEELEELGEFAERENVGRRYMNTIRRRKGLFVDEKIVEHSNKQRTMRKD